MQTLIIYSRFRICMGSNNDACFNVCYRILIYTNWFDLYKLYREGRLFRCLPYCHQRYHSLAYVYRKISSDLPSKGHSPISYGNFRNFDRETFRHEISQQDWSFNESEDPNLVWSKANFLRVVNSDAPFRTRRTKLNKTPWINSALKKGMRCRDAAKRKAIKTKNH